MQLEIGLQQFLAKIRGLVLNQPNLRRVERLLRALQQFLREILEANRGIAPGDTSVVLRLNLGARA